MPSTPSSAEEAEGPELPAHVLGRVMVVSPHYDDAVFSCGHLLSAVPESVVVTVCTAVPDDPRQRATDWDTRCGFSSAAEAMQTRCEENQLALDILRAQGVDIAFLDGQYLQSERNSMDLLSDTLLSCIREFRPDSVCTPLGLFHADHLLVADALLQLQHRVRGVRWLAYADIPYNKNADTVAHRTQQLAGRGVECEPIRLNLVPGRKREAVEAYRSQFRGLGHQDGAAIMQHEEQYWLLHQNLEIL